MRVGGKMGSGCRLRSAKDRGTVSILFSEQQGGFYKGKCHGRSNGEDRLCGVVWLAGGGGAEY